MKNWTIVSLIGLALLVGSCQSQDKNTPVAASARRGGWVVYPPLSDSELAQLTHVPLATYH